MNKKTLTIVIVAMVVLLVVLAMIFGPRLTEFITMIHPIPPH